MAKKQRIRCIFCLGYGLTDEHVIPDWVQEIIPKKPHHGHRLILNESIDPNTQLSRRPRQISTHAFQGHPISKKVHVVCKRCNTGWLSVLENELKPHIKALVLGQTLTLTPWGQRRLATWAAKTAMTAEFLHPKTAAITFGEREHLRLHRDPPKAFNVWMGHYDGSRYTADLHHHSVHISLGAPTAAERAMPPNTQATIIGLGWVYIQISSSSFDGLEFKLKDETVSNLRRIWPPNDSDLSWPPATSLTDQDIDIILNGLNSAFSETM